MTVYQQAVKELQTIRDFLRFGESLMRQCDVSCGHGFAEPWDEVVALVLHALHLPNDCDNRILDSKLVHSERKAVIKLLKQRAEKKIPTAYLIQEAWFADLAFKINANVLIPRSPIAELIEAQFQPWLMPSLSQPKILDLCTGSGCIGIACAVHIPDAEITLSDISRAALAIAKQNCQRLGVTERVSIIQSDLFEAIPLQQFDLIISNPPYVNETEYSELAAEYSHEPKLALTAGENGLAIVKRILATAKQYLSANGVLIAEVGNAEQDLINAYPNLPFQWLEFARGGQGVFLLTRTDLDQVNEW